MRESPSIVPWGDLDRTVYLALNGFGGRFGWTWHETDVAHTPVRIVAINTTEGWFRDASNEIAAELAHACADRGETPPRSWTSSPTIHRNSRSLSARLFAP
jgi:hypothetical protein